MIHKISVSHTYLQPPFYVNTKNTRHIYCVSRHQLTFLDIGESNDRGGLLVHDGAKTRASLDDAVGDAHLLAERWEPHDELDRIDIVGDDDELGLT